MPDSVLEQRYERLLLAYPAGYRAERGPEIVATLLDGAAPGRRVPRPAEVVDIVQAGLLERSRVASVPGLASGLAAAAPLALALATGISAFLWWRIEPMRPPVHTGQGWPFDGVTTLGPLAYAAWLLAALARAALRPAAGRLAIAIAIVMTVAVVPALSATPLGQRPPLWVLMALAGFGAVALIGTAPGLGAPAPSLDARLSGLAGAVAIAVCTSTAHPGLDPGGRAGPLRVLRPHDRAGGHRRGRGRRRRRGDRRRSTSSVDALRTTASGPPPCSGCRPAGSARSTCRRRRWRRRRRTSVGWPRCCSPRASRSR